MIVTVYIVVITTRMDLNKSYVLSNDSEKIILPSLEINDTNKNTLIKDIQINIQSHIGVSDIELIPQIITHHSELLDKEPNKLNMVIGFLVNYTDIINDNVHWVEFGYNSPDKYHNILYETIQKLR